jgi:phage gp29-like protein
VSQIIELADSGYTYEFVDLCNESRQKDCHLHSCLHARETALQGLELEVAPYVARGERAPSERDTEVAGAVYDALKQAIGTEDTSGLRDTVAHLQGGIYFGYSLAETVWDMRGKLMVPIGWHAHSPRRFGFRELDGKLVYWDQTGGHISGQQILVQKQWPGRWVQHQPRVTGDVPAREGLARILIWAALFRNWDLADWMKLAELSWKPWRIGEYKRGTTQQDIDGLIDILENLTTNGVATHVMDDVKINLTVPQGIEGLGKNHADLAAFMALEMSKAVLGQTLTVEPGSRGARSLGEVHERTKRDVRNADALAVAGVLRRDVVRWFVKFNYGDDVPIPGLRFATEDRADLDQFGSGMEKLAVKVGMNIPARWAHDQTGIPVGQPGEELLGGGTVPEPGDEGGDGEGEPEPDEPPADSTEPNGSEQDSYDVDLDDLDDDNE